MCDGHPKPTITVIKSKANKIFGGYTNDKWSSSFGSVKGVGTFIFSVDLKRTFPQLREQSIYCNKLIGPSFGGCELMVGHAK